MRRSLWGEAIALFSMLSVGTIIVAATHIPDRTAMPRSEQQNASGLPTLDVFIKPVAQPGGAVTHVDVRLEIGAAASAQPRAISLRIPVVFAGVPGIADAVEGVTAREGTEAVELKTSEDPADAGNFMYFRHWTTARPVSGVLTVDYRSRLRKAGPRSGPPFDLRSNGGGVSGAGAGFLLLPEEKRPFQIQLHWDLSQLPKGSAAITSLGEGDVRLTAPPDPLLASFYLAGPLGRFPNVGGTGFSAAWLGALPFDADSTLQWSAAAYQDLVKFFRDAHPAPFRVLFRVGPDNEAPGGAALTNSFLMFLPPAIRDADELRHTIVHEMVHHWGGGLDRAKSESNWFAEGVAEHYSRLVPFRNRLMTPDQYLTDFSHTVVRFYTNPLRHLPDAEIEARFWRDRNAQVLPYDRGAMYLAHLDGRLRAASKGQRSADSVVLEMLETQRQGKPATTETWLAALERNLGPSAREEFQKIIVKPESWEPDANAFGPCFARQPATYRLFDIGFDEWGTMYASPRLVKGLVPGSEAEKAGLRNDDVILHPLDLNWLRVNPDAHVNLRVSRGDRELTIDYLPRSATTVQAYRWIRAANVSEAQCRAGQ